MTKRKPKKEPLVLNKQELLRRVRFFNDLDDAIIDKFAEMATIQHFQHEETIILAGDSRSFVFFITKGHAKVFSGGGKGSVEIILSLLSPGDSFGEINAFGEKGRGAISVEAEGECSLIIFSAKDFFNIVVNNPKLSMVFLKELSRKLNKAYTQMISLSKGTTKKRVMACIMQFIEEFGTRIIHGSQNLMKLKNRPTQEQIAGMCGSSRESVNRELAALIKEGYIELDNKDLILLKDLPI